MRARICLISSIILLLVFNIHPSYSQQQATTISLTPHDIIKQAVHNATENSLLIKILVSFREFYTEKELYRNGKLKSYKIDRKLSYRGSAYPVDKRSSEEPELDINFSGLLLQAYEYSILDPLDRASMELIYKYKTEDYVANCQNCYIFSFKPKKNQPSSVEISPDNSGRKQMGIHETAMRMEGIIYIDKEYLFVRKFTAELSRPFSPPASLGLATAITASLDIEFEMKKFESDSDKVNIIGAKFFKISYQVKKVGGLLGYETREKILEYDCYFLNSQPVPTACQ